MDIERDKIKKEQRQKGNDAKEKRRLLAKKGMAKSRKRKLRTSLVAAVLATSLAGGVHAIGSVYSEYSKESERTIEKLKEEHIDLARIGLSEESIKTLEQYDKFFKDNENENVDTETILQMTRSILGLNEKIVKEKIALISGYSESNIKIERKVDIDAMRMTSIGLYTTPNTQGRMPDISYRNAGANLLGIANENTLPKELCDIVWNTEDVSELINNITNRKITDKKAVKKLKKYFYELQEFGSKELIRGKNGKMVLVDLIQEKREKMQDDDMIR